MMAARLRKIGLVLLAMAIVLVAWRLGVFRELADPPHLAKTPRKTATA